MNHRGSYSVPGGDVDSGGRLRLVADQSLHHERVLEVTDVVAVFGLALVDAWVRERGDTGSC